MIRFLLKISSKILGNRRSNRHCLKSKRKLNGHGCNSRLKPLKKAFHTTNLPKSFVEVVIENCKVNLLYLHLLDLDSAEREILREWYIVRLDELQKSIDYAHDYLVEGKPHES